MPRIYLLTSPEVRDPLGRIVRECGHEVVSPPYSWDANGADCVPTLVKFDAVVFDHNVSKFRYVEAGVWRGKGYPVVFVAGPSRRSHDDATKYSQRLGFHPVESVAHFAAWLRGEPPYLMPPAYDENGEHPEVCRACRVQLREHWNGRELVCPKCKSAFAVFTGGKS